MIAWTSWAHDAAQEKPPNLAVRWVRESAEYQALATQVFVDATDALRAARKGPKPWAVVLDLDETVLDNSQYQVEIDQRGESYGSESWRAWVEREEAGAVPGARAFLEAARARGASIVFLSNRKVAAEAATQANLQALNLWSEGDLLCLQADTKDKAPRRAQLQDGVGACSLGEPTRVGLYLGDNINDFPLAGERGAPAPLSLVGRQYFVLPNPMYGEFTTERTRVADE
jgi:5'-nucleotidase (lipoprotein e(P4) family)